VSEKGLNAHEHAFRFVTPASRRQCSTMRKPLAGVDACATNRFPDLKRFMEQRRGRPEAGSYDSHILHFVLNVSPE